MGQTKELSPRSVRHKIANIGGENNTTSTTSRKVAEQVRVHKTQLLQGRETRLVYEVNLLNLLMKYFPFYQLLA